MMIELWFLVAFLAGILVTIGWRWWRERTVSRAGSLSVIGTHADGTTRVLYRGHDLDVAKRWYRDAAGFEKVTFYVDAKQRGIRMLAVER